MVPHTNYHEMDRRFCHKFNVMFTLRLIIDCMDHTLSGREKVEVEGVRDYFYEFTTHPWVDLIRNVRATFPHLYTGISLQSRG